MKTFYSVTLLSFLVGMLIVCLYAPWRSTPGGSPGGGGSVGILAIIVAFFSIVIGGSAYFFRGHRTGEKDLME